MQDNYSIKITKLKAVHLMQRRMFKIIPEDGLIIAIQTIEFGDLKLNCSLRLVCQIVLHDQHEFFLVSQLPATQWKKEFGIDPKDYES